MGQQELLQSALSLAARGFRVFPLEPGTKRPAIAGWQDKATTDPKVIEAVWSQKDYNIGVRTGDGLLVVDVDVKAGKEGADTWAGLGLSDADKDTFTVETASGGWHVYYAGDGRNSAGRLGPGVDTRGLGGYVVGPGSTLRNGSGSGSYAVIRDSTVRPVPRHVDERLPSAGVHSEGRGRVPLVDLDRSEAVAQAEQYLLQTAPAVQGRGGDHHTFTVAAKLKDFGLSEGAAFEAMLLHWNERCVPPWEPLDLQAKVQNAYAYGENPPGSAGAAAAFAGIEPPPPPRRPETVWYRHGDGFDENVGWLYHKTLPKVGVGMIVGPPQSGKTFLALELARSLATRKPFFGVEPDDLGGTALLFAGTEGSAVPLRMAALREKANLPISSRPIQGLNERGALEHLAISLQDESRRMMETFQTPLRMVIIETLSASGLLNDELNNAEIARALSNLGTLSRLLGCLVIVTHHPPKSGSGPRGGGALIGSPDYLMEITRDEGAVRRVEMTKARDAEQRPLGSFTLVKTTVGKDDRGRPIETMTVSMGEAINPAARYSAFNEVFAQALEFAMIDEGDLVEGRMAVPLESVRQRFRDLKPGSKDRGNVASAFKRAFAQAESMGVIDSAVFDGERFLWRKDFDNGAA